MEYVVERNGGVRQMNIESATVYQMTLLFELERETCAPFACLLINCIRKREMR